MTPLPEKTDAVPGRRAYGPFEAIRPSAGAAGTPVPASERQAGVEDWENEGGHLSEQPRAAIIPTDVSLAASNPPGAGLAAMQARFATDFADALMGRHPYGDRHRSGIFRRSTEDEAGN